MFTRAKALRDSHISKAYDWATFMTELNKKNLVLTPWCETEESEQEVKKRSKEESTKAENEGEEILTGAAKTLCIPLEQPELPEGTKCFITGAPATKWVLWGRSY
jgi:prolyl-tRNA synthetase